MIVKRHCNSCDDLIFTEIENISSCLESKKHDENGGLDWAPRKTWLDRLGAPVIHNLSNSKQGFRGISLDYKVSWILLWDEIFKLKIEFWLSSSILASGRKW